MIDATFNSDFDLELNESTGDFEFHTEIDAFNQTLKYNVVDYFQEVIGSTDKEQVPKVVALKTAEIANELAEYADSIEVIDTNWVDEQKTELSVVVQYELGDAFEFTF